MIYNAIPPVLPRLLAQVLPEFKIRLLILFVLFWKCLTSPDIDWGNLSILTQDSSLLPRGISSLNNSVAVAKHHRQGLLLPDPST